MSIVQQSPPPAKRMKTVYAVGPVEGRNKWYLDEETADVHFVIGSDESSSTARIPAHKTLLARDSDVFKAMFYGPLKESGDIRLTDVSEAAFKEFLQFFYLTEVELTVENLADVMHLGHKYNVVNCVDVCIKFFKDVHDAGNILIGLGFGILYEHSELVTFCERFVVLNTDAVLKSNGLLECNRQTLAHILNANLFICSEVELFDACMKWVKAKSGHNVLTKEVVDEHLGELFYNIRFGTMTIEEFCSLSQKYGSVLSSDFQAIAKLIALPDVQQDRFNTRPRQYGTVVKCNCEENQKSREVASTVTGQLLFSTNVPLLLTAFTLCSPEYNSIQVKISRKCTDKWSEYFVTVFERNLKLQNRYVVQLPHSLLIRAEHVYKMTITFSGERVRLHAGLKEKVHLDCGAIVEYHDCKMSEDGTKIIGMVSAMEFNRV